MNAIRIIFFGMLVSASGCTREKAPDKPPTLTETPLTWIVQFPGIATISPRSDGDWDIQFPESGLTGYYHKGTFPKNYDTSAIRVLQRSVSCVTQPAREFGRATGGRAQFPELRRPLFWQNSKRNHNLRRPG